MPARRSRRPALKFVGGGGLHVTDAVAGCLGLVNDNDPLTLLAAYSFSPNTITILP